VNGRMVPSDAALHTMKNDRFPDRFGRMTEILKLHYLRATAASDLDFDPNSAGGVRIAGLGALWQAVILGFAGLDLKGDMLGVDPRLPPQWRSLSFRVCWRGRSVAIRITDEIVQATLVEGEGMEMRIGAATRTLAPGATLQVSV
jgi:trehalose/maltose hydrolase-like predicted phosphorylase